MVEELNKKVIQEAAKAETLGFDLIVDFSKEDIALVANEATNKVAVMGVVDFDDQEILVAYLININKWSWAEQEGFSRDQIVDKFSKEIFTWIPIDEVAERLNFS